MTGSQASTWSRRCAAVLLCAVLAACSPDSPDAAAPAPTPSSSPTAGAPPADLTYVTCQQVGSAVSTLHLSAAFAITDDKPGAALRAGVAQAYLLFAQQLDHLMVTAPADLAPTLMRWAAASTDVAQFVARNRPKRGIVVDLGPPHDRWQAAEKAAEKICGHPLPDTRSTPASPGG